MGWLQLMFGALIMLVTISSLSKIYSDVIFLHNKHTCQQHFYRSEAIKDIDLLPFAARVGEVLFQLETLQENLESTVRRLEMIDKLANISTRFLKYEVIKPLYNISVALRQMKNVTVTENSLIDSFVVEEIRKYITPKENRAGKNKINIYGAENVHNTIGHGCILMKKELEEYMDYDVGSYCNDDWNLAQKLMIHGCDPLPRRRCLTRASKLYLRPYPVNESLWKIPDGRNVRWSNYRCRNFDCLSSKNPRRGYSKCTGCFEMEKEKLKWVKIVNISLSAVDFPVTDVLKIKPGEMRIGLDHGVGTGTFAARMREQNVTIVSTAMNLGAPFNEMIALRGLIPLYVTLNQRLPFFDNTMDMIHTAGLVDGWMDLELLDFILFDWDRVLRPGGLLWIDRFFCEKKDLDDYMYMFLQFRYRKHKWAIARKSKDQVYLSALLEKPPRSL